MTAPTMYNEVDAPFGELGEIDALDWRMRDDVFIGNAAFTGCVVSAQGTPDGTVSVSAGTARINTSDVTCAGGTVSVLTGSANPDGSTASAPHATLQRYDLIVLNAAGTLGVIHGAVTVPTFQNHQVVKPKYPAWATSSIVLAVIYVLPSSEANAGKISIGTPGSDHSELIRKTQLMSKSMLYDDPHLTTGGHHTGPINDTMHGVRTLANAHDLADLSGLLTAGQGLGKPLALAGAVSATRYVGATASVAPTTGTFAVGDFVVTLTGKMFVCTTAGTPGTWTQVGGVGLATDTLADAKGDVFAASAPDTIVRIPVGTNGQALVADSAATAGVSWRGGLLASLTQPSAAIANTETVILTATIPANYLKAGDTFIARVAGVGTTSTSPGNGNWRLRFNPTTLTGSSVLAFGPAFTASLTGVGFMVEFEMNVYTIGATGTLKAEARGLAPGSTYSTGLFTTAAAISISTATLTVDTTVQNLLEFTFQSGAASANTTAYTGFIRQL